MSKPSITTSFSILCAALSIGCLQPSTAKDESADDVTPSETASIYDIQMGTYAEGTVLNVSGAVVTTPVIPGDNAGFFIQSAEGGEFTGIYIYMYDEVAEAYSDRGRYHRHHRWYAEFTELAAEGDSGREHHCDRLGSWS